MGSLLVSDERVLIIVMSFVLYEYVLVMWVNGLNNRLTKISMYDLYFIMLQSLIACYK